MAAEQDLEAGYDIGGPSADASITEVITIHETSFHGSTGTEPLTPEVQKVEESHFVAEHTDPFDTTTSDWSYGRHLAASLTSGDETERRPPSAEMSVLVDKLRVVGAGSGATYQDTLGEFALKPFTIFKNFLSKKKSPEKTILHNIDGVVRTGEMLLVLGRPGSGCSTLLKNMAGFNDGYVRTEGNIKYNGVDVSVIKKQFRGDVAYNAEVEANFPHLTVGQTLDFAVESRAPAPQRQTKIKGRYIANNTDMLATTFGLRHTLKTKVGNDFVRGVSGGERKRVSLAEVLSTRASVGYWDNPTRGLDASTSLEFATIIRSNTSIARNTAIVAAYQAGEKFTLLFDKVTILYQGRQIFFGTLSDAKAHFDDLGFLSIPHQTTADYLTAITDPKGRRIQKGRENETPRSPDDFVKAWKASVYYTQLRQEMDRYNSDYSAVDAQLQRFKNIKVSQLAKHQRPNSRYTATLQAQIISTIKRSFQRILGDRAYLIAGASAAIIMALINGSIFVNTPENTSGFFSKGGVIFFSVLYNALQTMTEVATQYEQRPIIQKQNGFAMYHPFMDSLASTLAIMPFKFVNIFLFDLILYFMVGLKKEPGPFFIFFLITYLTTLAMSGLFRTIAAVTKESEAANGIAGVLVLVLAIYTGYVIPVPSMHPWFAWLRFINPVAYGFEAILVNEFHSQNGECTQLVPSGHGYENVSIHNQVCAVTGAKAGESFVSGDAYLSASFEYEFSHLWRDVAILTGFTLFFIFTSAFAAERNRSPPGKGEFLVFRRGHEPAHVKKALLSGRAVADFEDGDNTEVLATAETKMSKFRTLDRSKDVFTWEHLDYDITLSDGTVRKLLKDVTGYVKPGTLTALMGESGAGKTTLLNVLAQRIDIGVVTGDMSVNGLPCPSSFQRQTGYVQQQDVHTAESTVREALRFSAILRQSSDISIEQKYEYVEQVIEMLDMVEYAEAVIGSPGNGLNVEQRKRTTIGIELVARPALLLFLDEPTSGLDSQSAWSIVRLLRKLANSGQAILCTIHQPSSVLFEQFDRLLLLQKGGRTVYFGDIGQNSKDIIQYFEENGAAKCQHDENPAEYILQVIGAGATAKVDRDWGDLWSSTSNAREVAQETGILKVEYKEQAGDRGLDDLSSAFAASWFSQYKAVQLRVFQVYWRSPNYVISKVFLNVVAGLFLGFTFYQEDNSVQGLQNKLFAVFMGAILAMPLMNQMQPKWAERTTLYCVREKPSKVYHWSTFVLANLVVELPYNFCSGTLFFVCWYFAVGLFKPFSGSARNNRGVYEWLMLMIFQLWWSTFGQAIAAISPNAQTASTLTTLFGAFVITFNGVLQPLSALIPFWHWMYHLSPYTYLIGGLVSNVLSGTSVTCSPIELNIFDPPSGQTCQEYAGLFLKVAGTLVNPEATSSCEYCRYANGDQYLRTRSMNYDDRWRNFGFLSAYVTFNISAAFCFFYLTKVAKINLTAFKAKMNINMKAKKTMIAVGKNGSS